MHALRPCLTETVTVQRVIADEGEERGEEGLKKRERIPVVGGRGGTSGCDYKLVMSCTSGNKSVGGGGRPGQRPSALTFPWKPSVHPRSCSCSWFWRPELARPSAALAAKGAKRAARVLKIGDL